MEKYTIYRKSGVLDTVEADTWAVTASGALVFYTKEITGSEVLRHFVAAYGSGMWDKVVKEDSKGMKRFLIFRRAVLQEDEGHEHPMGHVAADNENAACAYAALVWGGNYFHASDFRAVEDE